MATGKNQHQHDPTDDQQSEVMLKTIYHSLLRIIAHWGETPYTEENHRQTAERQPDGLADPASERPTSPG